MLWLRMDYDSWDWLDILLIEVLFETAIPGCVLVDSADIKLAAVIRIISLIGRSHQYLSIT
jgi:hypothetical protein